MIHQMRFNGDQPGGMEEWYCPICGRTYLIQWTPWRRIVTVVGDERAVHSGSKGGLNISDAEITDPLLDVWRDAIEKLDF